MAHIDTICKKNTLNVSLNALIILRFCVMIFTNINNISESIANFLNVSFFLIVELFKREIFLS